LLYYTNTNEDHVIIYNTSEYCTKKMTHAKPSCCPQSKSCDWIPLRTWWSGRHREVERMIRAAKLWGLHIWTLDKRKSTISSDGEGSKKTMLGVRRSEQAKAQCSLNSIGRHKVNFGILLLSFYLMILQKTALYKSLHFMLHMSQ
jgi:hypothetical protein